MSPEPRVPSPGSRTYLQIGEVSALTGILPGRIRHYESIGLIAPGHLESGYRTFSVEDVLRLLHIDLLRSLGMGLGDIQSSVDGQPGGLVEALRWHQQALVGQRERLDVLIAAVDDALAQPSENSEAMIMHLAEAHREASLGIFGRLEKPLSPKAANVFGQLLGDWKLPVPGLFAQMLLPAPISDFLERLADTPGQEQLFGQLRSLAERVVQVALAGDEQAADDLGKSWVAEQLASPPSEPVAQVLRQAGPRLLQLPVLRYGFRVWAESMSPLAARVLAAIETEAERRGLSVLGAIVIPLK